MTVILATMRRAHWFEQKPFISGFPPFSNQVVPWGEPTEIAVTSQELARLRGLPSVDFTAGAEANARGLFGVLLRWGGIGLVIRGGRVKDGAV